MKELFQDRNFRSFIRLALGCAAGWLAKRGIEIDGATVELFASALTALVSIAWSAYDNRRKTDGQKGTGEVQESLEKKDERGKADEEGNAG